MTQSSELRLLLSQLPETLSSEERQQLYDIVTSIEELQAYQTYYFSLQGETADYGNSANSSIDSVIMEAAQDLTEGQLVEINSQGKVVLATSKILGVVTNTVKAGSAAVVQFGGITKLISGVVGNSVYFSSGTQVASPQLLESANYIISTGAAGAPYFREFANTYGYHLAHVGEDFSLLDIKLHHHSYATSI